MSTTVTVPDLEWQKYLSNINELFECHRALRLATRLILHPEEFTEEEAAEVREYLQHFRRDFLPALWTVE